MNLKSRVNFIKGFFTDYGSVDLINDKMGHVNIEGREFGDSCK